MTRTFASAVVLTLLGAAAFHLAQNRLAWFGGSIAPQKTAWLFTALFAWLVLPAILACDRRLPWRVRRGYVVFLALMLARGAVELPLMYGTRGWSPLYGIAHDAVCMLLLVALYVTERPAAKGGDARHRIAVANYLALAALFVPEIAFAAYMRRNFDTAGDAAVFFVPDEPAHRLVLDLSAASALAFATYLAWFAPRWLRNR